MQVVWLGREHCSATWQSEASIPPSIIREYECGIQLDTSVQSLTYGWQTNHALHVHDDNVSPPKQKKQKVAEKRYVHINIHIRKHFSSITNLNCALFREPVPDIGVYQEIDEHALSCNTEKDKRRLNERTAGIYCRAGIFCIGKFSRNHKYSCNAGT